MICEKGKYRAVAYQMYVWLWR